MVTAVAVDVLRRRKKRKGNVGINSRLNIIVTILEN
jgi:hypothetical protein